MKAGDKVWSMGRVGHDNWDHVFGYDKTRIEPWLGTVTNIVAGHLAQIAEDDPKTGEPKTDPAFIAYVLISECYETEARAWGVFLKELERAEERLAAKIERAKRHAGEKSRGGCAVTPEQNTMIAIIRDGKEVIGNADVKAALDALVHQANAAETLRALALAVIAMPSGASVDNIAATGYRISLRTLAAAMLAKAEDAP